MERCQKEMVTATRTPTRLSFLEIRSPPPAPPLGGGGYSFAINCLFHSYKYCSIVSNTLSISFITSSLLNLMTVNPCDSNHCWRMASVICCCGSWWYPPSNSMTSFAGMQQKSAMKQPMMCWRLNGCPSCRFLRYSQRTVSASVAFCLFFLAKSFSSSYKNGSAVLNAKSFISRGNYSSPRGEVRRGLKAFVRSLTWNGCPFTSLNWKGTKLSTFMRR